MAEPTHNERIDLVKIAARKVLGNNLPKLEEFERIEFYRLSPADLTDLERRFGGRVT